MNNKSYDVIISDLYIPKLLQEYGSESFNVINRLVDSLYKIFRSIDEKKFEEISVMCGLQPNPLLKKHYNVSPIDISELKYSNYAKIIIEISKDDIIYIIEDEITKIKVHLNDAIIYHKNENSESFFLKSGNRLELPEQNVYFRIPYFKSLSEALLFYKNSFARRSSCHILSENLWSNKNRIIFSNKPEKHMQTSLHNFLRARLRNYLNIQRESNTQNSNSLSPVDISVSWNHSRHIALIEIKWLGLSKGGQKGTEYRQSRALDGAKQLAEYLDNQLRSNPESIPRGYLVIFDGRRDQVSISTESIDKKCGMAFLNKEISFNPEYHKTRDDFEEPIRMFMEPICS